MPELIYIVKMVAMRYFWSVDWRWNFTLICHPRKYGGSNYFSLYFGGALWIDLSYFPGHGLYYLITLTQVTTKSFWRSINLKLFHPKEISKIETKTRL